MLVLMVSEEVALERLLNSGRSDDQEETILARLEVFRQESQPVIERLKDVLPAEQVAELDSGGSVDEIFSGISIHIYTNAIICMVNLCVCIHGRGALGGSGDEIFSGSTQLKPRPLGP